MAISQLSLDDDAAIVFAVQQGDTDAFGELFKRHYESVRRVCARRLGNLAEADEIAQAAFVRAFERIDRCGGDRRFGAWVQVIASRLCIDHLRATSRTTPDEEPVKGDKAIGPNAPEEQLLLQERTHHVHEALATLPDRQREVVIARHFEGRGPGEIAASLGLSVGAVDSLLLRARRRLAISYDSLAPDAGTATLQATAVAAVAGGTVATGPSRAAMLISNARDVVDRISFKVAHAMGMVPGASTPGANVHRAVAMVVVGAAAATPTGAGLLGVAPPAVPPVVEHAIPAVPELPPVAAPPAPAIAPPALPGMPTPGDVVQKAQDLAPDLPAVPEIPSVAAPPAAVPPTTTPAAPPVLGGLGNSVGQTVDDVTGAVTDTVTGATDAVGTVVKGTTGLVNGLTGALLPGTTTTTAPAAK